MTHIPTSPLVPPCGTIVTEITPADLPAVIAMLHALADYEEASDLVKSTTESLHTAMFGARPLLLGFIARKGGDPAGIILGYETYGTFAAAPRLFIEDLFVRAECRGGGIGRMLIAAVARRCLARGYAGMQWRVLECNGPGIRFYRAMGAIVSAEHRHCSLAGPALRALADNPGMQPDFRFADMDGRFLSRSGGS